MDKQYQYKQEEARLRQLWHESNTYSQSQQDRPVYAIDTPPPTVSGSLHIGHIFSYTQTDIIARYRRLAGYNVFYPFGFDDNGLPTERFVEKMTGVSAHSVGRAAFIQLCLEKIVPVEEQFKQLWERMGLSVNWQSSYSTIDDRARALSQASFITLYKKGFIYRRNEPAPYCPTCRTSVAQAELEDMQKPSCMYRVQFEAADTHESVVIATTRPELLPACVAVMVHPDDVRYSHLIGKLIKVPLIDRWVPCIADEQVVPEKGTGVVMCCTFGDKTDIAWWKQHKLDYKESFGRDGKLVAGLPLVAGLNAQQGRAAVVDALAQANLILQQTPLEHAVNVHERCKKEVEYLLLPQWFLSLLPHKKALIELADQVSWNPEYMKPRYINWVENITWDWCLSRQRYFGIPFPAWHCVDCAAIHMPELHELPIDPQSAVAPTACTQCGSIKLVADTDVMDTWNTSSLTPYLCAAIATGEDVRTIFDKPVSFIPMAMRPQAHDIIRTWAFYTLVKVWMHQGSVAWRDIVISGHVQTSDKAKISKSQGNNPLDPDKLLEKYAADAIRFWTASARLGTDVMFSDQQLMQGQRLLTKLWNALRFVYEHAASVDLSAKPAELSLVNRWILHRLTISCDRYQECLNSHEFSLALASIDQTFWADFCDNYLELVKDQLFNPQNYDAHEVVATKWTLAQAGLQILQLYAPFIPYITESLYQLLYKERVGVASLHQTQLSVIQQAAYDEEADAQMQAVLAIIGAVRRLKSEHQLSLKTPLETLTIAASESTLELLAQHESLLKGATAAKVLVYEPASGATQTALRSQAGADAALLWYAHVAQSGE
jgi:valyl-tRNA synthetase